MGEYQLSEQAFEDLEGIFVSTIEVFGLAQAETSKRLLEAGLARVAEDPRLGRKIKGRTRTFFQYNCERHGIFFAKQDGSIFVVRVLHLSMDFKRQLPKREV